LDFVSDIKTAISLSRPPRSTARPLLRSRTLSKSVQARTEPCKSAGADAPSARADEGFRAHRAKR